MKISANQPCPCHSGRNAKGCCLPYLRGRQVPTPEALVRSRYTAYASGQLNYLMSTTHPDGPNFMADRERWEHELRMFCDAISFDGLVIHAVEDSETESYVDFTAELTQDGRDRSFRERSVFTKISDRWLYVSGDSDATDVIHR